MRETMLTLCREQLAKFKVPREVIFVPALPRVGFGKISKAQIRDQILKGQINEQVREQSAVQDKAKAG